MLNYKRGDFMEKWKENLRKITPYTPGEQSKNKNIIKLNANENPYPPSPKSIEVFKNFDCEKLKFYPDANSNNLKKSIADFYGVKPENVFVANGSDDVIAIAFQSFFCSKKPVFFPDITYSFYPVWCELFKIPYQTIPVDENFKINFSDYERENGGVIIPNPNAPTSIGEDEEFVENLLKCNQDSVVIIDEAYADFSEYTCVPLIKKYKNLAVTGTFSKSRSLAGLRIGFAIADKELISVLEAVKNSYNSYCVDSLSIAVASASIKDEDYFKETVQKVKNTRKKTTEKLRELGFDVLNSQTNFVFATIKDKSMKDLFEYLKSKNIFIRYFNLPRIDNYIRITIGTDEEMEILLNETENYLKNNNTV